MNKLPESWQGVCIGLCAHCLTNAPFYTAHNACCQLRMLAQAPKHRIRAYTDTMTFGERDVFRVLYLTERARLARLKLKR